MANFFISTEAQRLADRPYSEIIFPDLTTDGQPIYVAKSPEFLACIADGDTAEEALATLKVVRAIIIQHYLEHNVAVPIPQSQFTALGTGL